MQPQYEPDLDVPPSRRRWYFAVVGIIVVAALAIGVYGSLSAPEKFAGGEHELDGINEPQGYGKPDDGLDSIGLPVTVTPATELVDGQVVQISATGFPANTQVGLIQCTSQSIELGQSACDMSTLTYASVGTGGGVTASFQVRQHLSIGGTPVDCATGNVDPAGWVSAQRAAEGQFTCILGVGSIANYDISGNSAIAFEGAVFGGPPPPIPDISATTTTYQSMRTCSEPPIDAYDDVCVGGEPSDSPATTTWTGEAGDVLPTTSTSLGRRPPG